MKLTSRVMMVLMVLAALSPGTAHAAPGCIAIATPFGSMCEYTADGPGEFTAVTANHWQIFVYRDDQQIRLPSNGRFPASPGSGPLATQAGDRVVVWIDKARIDTNATPALPGVSAGYVAAGKGMCVTRRPEPVFGLPEIPGVDVCV